MEILRFYGLHGGGNNDIIDVLTNHKVNINQANNIGYNALTWAALNGKINTVKKLIELGIEIEENLINNKNIYDLICQNYFQDDKIQMKQQIESLIREAVKSRKVDKTQDISQELELLKKQLEEERERSKKLESRNKELEEISKNEQLAKNLTQKLRKQTNNQEGQNSTLQRLIRHQDSRIKAKVFNKWGKETLKAAHIEEKNIKSSS